MSKSAREKLAARLVSAIDLLAERGAAPADLLAWRQTNLDTFIWAESFIDVPDGTMVAFYPSAAIAKRLAIKGYEPHEDLHVTLALPGKVSEQSTEQLKRLPTIIRGFAMISRPLTGRISGVTEFPAHEGKKPIVALLDVPGLTAWRQRLIEILALNGYAAANDHGFIPHMTLAYIGPEEHLEIETPSFNIEFDQVDLNIGTKRKAYNLGGNPEVDDALESFALRGAGVPGRKRAEVEAVNAYQTALQREYQDWADDLARDLAEEDDDDARDEIIAAALLALLALLSRLGREKLPDAVALGSGGTQAPGTVWARLSAAIEANDRALAESLIPAIKLKLDELLNNPDVIQAIQFGGDAGAAAISGGLLSFLGRVGMAAGAWWGLWNATVGGAAQEDGRKIYWYRDAAVKNHCDSCLEFGEREYESYESMLLETGAAPAFNVICGSNCRCWLEPVE